MSNTTVKDAPAKTAKDAKAEPANGLSKRRLESRRKLIAAARQLFVERGYHATRPQDISKLAGVGHGTFYLHFTDKLDCFLTFADEVCDELEVVLDKHLDQAKSVEDAVKEILYAVYEYSDANPGALATAMTNTAMLSVEETKRRSPTERWAAQWAKMVEQWREERGVSSQIDPALSGHLIVGAISQGMAYGYLYGVERDKLVHDIAQALFGALTRE
ncbi:TetR/AcrR family transcriptional regulator [Tepidicaulis sp. LMO-SS28]|uniref:TetR/AcrR family transcriptional regulator n=1 Tax=Tepidicaulis sp. LMO-SS28 TaxID=3447455 RepID=UPI003EDED279